MILAITHDAVAPKPWWHFSDLLEYLQQLNAISTALFVLDGFQKRWKVTKPKRGRLNEILYATTSIYMWN